MRTEILKTIYNIDPALLEKHIEMVITALPSASPREQTVLLGAIFTASPIGKKQIIGSIFPEKLISQKLTSNHRTSCTIRADNAVQSGPQLLKTKRPEI